jgi:hypothetical protein
MKIILTIAIFVTIASYTFSQTGTFTFSTAADNGNNVTETVSSRTLTVTTGSGVVGLWDGSVDFGLNPGTAAPQCYNESGNSMTLTFTGGTVNIASLRCMEGVGANFNWNFTPTGGSNSPVTNQAVNGTNGTTITLNFIGITSITITESSGAQEVYFGVDNIVIDASLPVELTSFTASSLDNKVNLNWQTATEVDNYGFQVQRTKDKGQSMKENEWEEIGFVNGHGNSNSVKEYSFIDKDVTDGKYSYRLKQIDNDGDFEYSPIVEVEINNIPTQISLEQNYPNPFNPTTTIKFGIPEAGVVDLRVYNILGEEVAQLVNKELQPGDHSVTFGGNNLSSGLYIYRINVEGKFSSVKKMLMMK